MCIGIPMQIVETGLGYAWCEGMGEKRRIDTQLVGDLPVGTWVMTFIDSAREVLEPEDAERITNAVEAVNLVMQGETNIDHLFADLVGREPQLPDFVKPKRTEKASGDH